MFKSKAEMEEKMHKKPRNSESFRIKSLVIQLAFNKIFTRIFNITYEKVEGVYLQGIKRAQGSL